MNIFHLFCKPKPYVIELFPDKDIMWRWRIRHENGEILCSSESYSQRAKAQQTAANLARHARFQLVEVIGDLKVRIA